MVKYGMAEIFIHLAIAKRAMEKSKDAGLKDVQNRTDFYRGNVLPDLDPNKERSHFGRRVHNDIATRNLEKVNPDKYRDHHDMTSFENRGYYMHLLTDWEYYNNFIKYDVATYDKDVILTFNYHRPYLIKKYNLSLDLTGIDLTDFVNAFKPTDPTAKLIYSAKELDEFIERVSGMPF